MNEINYPSVTTFFISYNDNDINPHYGEVGYDQCMTTQKSNIFITIDKDEYISELLIYGITLTV